MRFDRYARQEFRDTPRKRAAYTRKLVAEQVAMPLFAAEIAAMQTPVDQAMARRAALFGQQLARDRARRASQWRLVRTRLRQYPALQRVALQSYWQQCCWPGTPEYLSMMLGMHARGELELRRP